MLVKRLNIVKMYFSKKLMHGVNIIPIKTSETFFVCVENHKLILRFQWKMGRIWNSWNTFQKGKTEFCLEN